MIAIAIVVGASAFGLVFHVIKSASAAYFQAADPVLAAPLVSTEAANPIGTTTAALHSKINAGGVRTDYWFEYGTDPLFSATSSSPAIVTKKAAAGRGASSISFGMDIKGLDSGTVYYYRVAAENELGITLGSIETFTMK